MTISEVIEKLQKAKEKYGDVDVSMVVHEDDDCHYEPVSEYSFYLSADNGLILSS